MTFDHVSYGYTQDQPILKDISFSIKPGQKVAIVGPSGTGKSTLIGLLSRLYDPVSGQVLIDGSDIRHFTLESLRTQISVVLQDTLLFATTIEENIAYGAPGSSAAEIREAARLANIHDFITSLPDKYDTKVGERGATLSVGQRQRIALARTGALKDYTGEVSYPGYPVDTDLFGELPPEVVQKLRESNADWGPELMESEFRKAKEVADRYALPLYCGEFGCFPSTSLELRHKYYKDITSVFEKLDISWTHWNYKNDFPVVDEKSLEPIALIVSGLLD